MAEIDLTFIGAELRRLQHDMCELRIRVDYNNSEGRALSDVLREEMGRNIAGLHARMDAFDQRFNYVDETISQLRQELNEIRRDVSEVRRDLREGRQDIGEIKALLLAGRAG
jgi:septal ring factor EnvC (AmiA/AmiB activator)